MKYLLATLILTLTGCAQLQHGQEQPVISKFSKEKGEYFFTTCGGAVEEWNTCYQKAHRTCASGYSIVSKYDNNKGTQRELTFQCNK